MQSNFITTLLDLKGITVTKFRNLKFKSKFHRKTK